MRRAAVQRRGALGGVGGGLAREHGVFTKLSVFLILAACCGCAGALQFDSARSLPKGAVSAGAGLAGGYQHNARHRFTPASAAHNSGVVSQDLPGNGFDLDVAGRARFGVGHGVQLEVTLTLLGLGFGTKYQFLGGEDGLFAWSVGARTGISGFGDGDDEFISGALGTYFALAETTVSVHLGNHFVALSPRLHFSYLMQSHTVEDHTTRAFDSALSWGGSLIYGYQFPSNADLMAECSALHTPEHSGLGLVCGLGVMFDAGRRGRRP